MYEMRYRTLGRTGWQVSDIGFGAWGIGGAMWQGSRDLESAASLRAAIGAGVNFIDTALVYGEGHSERLVGQAVRGAGRKVYVATKAPPKNYLWPARPGIPIKDVFPYRYIIECTEKSLLHLGMDSVDLQQLHVWNPEWLASDDWRRAAEDLKRSGKIRAFGVSINDHQPDSALELIETGVIDTVQVIYNIFDQTPETRLFPLCLERNIGVLARVPLDEGSLAGTITETTTFPPGDFRNQYFGGDRKRQVVSRVNALRNDLWGAAGTLPEIALRYCLSHPAVSTVIPGMRKLENVKMNCALSDQGALDPETLAVLKRHAWDRNFYS
jgi:aryl-alcohol dehydrogenase-like predicted oxidoreductase